MNKKGKMMGLTIAAAAALSFAVAPIASIAQAHKVECMGVNSCKGMSKCKTAENACKGQNSCKGKGMMEMTAKKCKKMGGTVVTHPEGSADKM